MNRERAGRSSTSSEWSSPTCAASSARTDWLRGPSGEIRCWTSLVHGQDLSRPIGRPLVMPIDAARTAADWAWQRGFPFFPARRFRGIRMIADDIDWHRGIGEELRGPIASLLLLSTGRHSAVADLSGPGLRASAVRGATARR